MNTNWIDKIDLGDILTAIVTIGLIAFWCYSCDRDVRFRHELEKDMATAKVKAAKYDVLKDQGGLVPEPEGGAK